MKSMSDRTTRIERQVWKQDRKFPHDVAIFFWPWQPSLEFKLQGHSGQHVMQFDLWNTLFKTWRFKCELKT